MKKQEHFFLKNNISCEHFTSSREAKKCFYLPAWERRHFWQISTNTKLEMVGARAVRENIFFGRMKVYKLKKKYVRLYWWPRLPLSFTGRHAGENEEIAVCILRRLHIWGTMRESSLPSWQCQPMMGGGEKRGKQQPGRICLPRRGGEDRGVVRIHGTFFRPVSRPHTI